MLVLLPLAYDLIFEKGTQKRKPFLLIDVASVEIVLALSIKVVIFHMKVCIIKVGV